MAQQLTGSARDEWRRHWPLVGTTTAAVSLSVLPTASFGVMLGSIEADSGWTRAEISSGPTLVSICALFLATLAGYAIDRLGARRIGLFVALSMVVGIALMSTAGGSLWQWWAIWAIFAFAAAANPAVWLTPVSGLFNAGRGTAIAVTLSGIGITMTIVPPFTHYLNEAYGWRNGYLALAAIWGAVVLPLVFLLFRGAEEAGPNKPETEKADPDSLPGLTVREGFRRAAIWKMLGAGFAASLAAVSVVMNLVPILVSTGMDKGSAAWLAGFSGLGSLAGMVVGGPLLDRFSARSIIVVTTLLPMSLPLGLLFAPTSIPVMTAAVLLSGAMGGVRISAIVYLVSRYFGARSFGTFYGTVSTTTGVSAGLGPILANYVYDLNHSYELVIWAALPGYVLAAALYASLGAYPDFGDETMVRK